MPNPNPTRVAWPPGSPRLFCRVHGEPLHHDWQRLAWVCPVRHVCGTWVGHEVIYRRRAAI